MNPEHNKDLSIVDDRPAPDWAERFFLGNGRIGAAAQGGAEKETVSLNHDLLWRRSFQGPGYRTARDMDELRARCAAGEWTAANETLKRTLQDQNGIYTDPFVPFCDVYLDLRTAGETVYGSRALDLRRGIAGTTFRAGTTEYRRECFCSAEYGLFAMRVSSSDPVGISGEISLSRMDDPECTVTGAAAFRELTVNGAFDEGKRFCAVLRIICGGGRTAIGKRGYDPGAYVPASERRFGLYYSFDRDAGYDRARGPSLIFDSCAELTVLVALATDDEAACPEAYAKSVLDRAASYETMREAHVKSFSSYFDRTRLYLSGRTEVNVRALRDELRRTGELSPALLEAGYNVARYLAIGAGMPQRPGDAPKAPIHLQGLWCRDLRPAWDCDLHLDLNLEMCYWPLAAAGLPEWYEPLLQWAERLLPDATRCAKELYGCRGAAYNGCCGPWKMGCTDTVGFGFLGGGAWIAQVLWIRYTYEPSTELLSRLVGLMRPMATFYEDMLTGTADGSLTYPFGASPEMGIRTEQGVQWLAGASVCDLLLTRELFLHLAQALRTLDAEKNGEEAERYESLASKIRPVMRGGEVGEWADAFPEAEPGHRHRSPFICFCPGDSVTQRDDPALVRALKELLDRRLAAGHGRSASFSYVWDAQILARLGDGERARALLAELMRVHLLPNGTFAVNDYEGLGGLAWFPGVKVMQIEASIGLIGAITELVFQDLGDGPSFLPALPAALENGRLIGVRGRDGAVYDIEWENGKPTRAEKQRQDGD